VLLFGFALAWGLRNDLQSWRTTVLYYCWIVFGMLSFLIPPMFLQVFVLTGLGLVSLLRPWNSTRWLQWGFLLTTMAWGGGGYWCYQSTERHYEELREQFPLVSFGERIPHPPSSCPEDVLMSEAVEANLAGLERDLRHDWYSLRAKFLEGVHEHTLHEFFEREGLGIERMPLPYHLEEQVAQRVGPFPQIGPSWSNEGNVDLGNLRNAEQVSGFDTIHRKNTVNFAFPEGFGFVRDRAQIAGFESHRFRGPLKSNESWKIVHIELVSLLLHNPPVVYRSDELPRMDRVKQVSTRVLDPFEKAALARIKKGEDLIVADVPKGLRMLGAIRNARQCIPCHEGKRGDLLGAFAYSIQTTGNRP